MECVICKNGTTRSGFVTVICQNCGEYYLSESVTAKVLQKAEDAVNKGAEVDIIRYVA